MLVGPEGFPGAILLATTQPALELRLIRKSFLDNELCQGSSLFSCGEFSGASKGGVAHVSKKLTTLRVRALATDSTDFLKSTVLTLG